MHVKNKETTISSRVRSLAPSPTLGLDTEVKNLRAEGIPVINLGLGEPDFSTPAHIVRAGVAALAQGFTHYTETPGIPELREEIAKKLRRDNKISYLPSEVVAGVGSKQILYHAFQALCERGDHVVIPTPTWTTYVEQVKLAGALPVYCKLTSPFKLTALALAKRFSPRTRVLLLNSPANPTGATIDQEELRRIAELAVRTRIFVISDEIYEKILYQGKHRSIASFGPRIRERTLTVNGFSKAYAMTGWRIGYAAGPERLIRAITSLQSQTTSNTSSIAQKAAIEALRGSQAPLARMRQEFTLRREFLVRSLSRIDSISFVPPEGAFYLFVNVQRLLNHRMPTASAWCAKLLKEKRVAIVPGESFLAPGFVRISFAASMHDLKRGARRIADFSRGR
ncbi:MAG: pyridoxal phosphate-dependent aminotransferase [Candidatus Liptonbacteria bacterium]|nr:pyridoxal phosphate-dependent aminotransferase [Candidatus Liptonbacteria bacterium]